jgi:hypothetical protein
MSALCWNGEDKQRDLVTINDLITRGEQLVAKATDLSASQETAIAAAES